MNLTNLLRRGLVAVVAAASVVGGVAGTTRAEYAAAATPPTVSATATTHAPADGALTAVNAPSRPRSPRATPRNHAVKLTWLAPSSNGGAKINTYRVQRATSATGKWKTIAKPTVRRFRATGLANGKRYYFRVAAHNAAGWSTPSKLVSAVPRTVPTAPRSPTATPANKSVKLTWLRPSSNGGATVDKYAVQRAVAGVPWKTIAYPTTRSYTAGGLTNGKKYYFRVRAHNAAGWGPYSTVVNAVPSTAPSAPPSMQAFPHNAAALLSWPPPLSSGGATIDRYEVTSSTNQVNWTSLGTTTKTTMLAIGLTNGTTYSFSVRAHNEAGWGPWTSAVSVVPYTVPSAPVGLWSYHDQLLDIVTWYWSPPAKTGGAAVDHYVLEFAYPNFPDVWSAWKTTSDTFLTAAVSPGKTFYFRVKAHNAAGYGPASNTTTVTTP